MGRSVVIRTIIALLAAALVVADAHRTIIRTVEVEEENQGRGQQQRCRQMRAQEEIGSCQEYLRQQSRYVLEMRGIENQRRRGGDLFNECCRELRNVDEECRCELLEEIAGMERRKGGGPEERQLFQRARNLPSMCGIRPQQCYF